MMEAAQNRLRYDATISLNAMSLRPRSLNCNITVRNTRPEARMGPAPVIVSNPFFENHMQMPFAEQDQEIKALPPHGADEPFAESIRLRCPEWRLQNP